ncbi:hypothetical protein ACFLZ5_06445 [Thermodesulfobacteriota bacterium]
MKKSIMIKYALLLVIIFAFLQCIFVSWAQQDKGGTIKKELILPAPALPTL